MHETKILQVLCHNSFTNHPETKCEAKWGGEGKERGLLGVHACVHVCVHERERERERENVYA